jgi:hypothetical protein
MLVYDGAQWAPLVTKVASQNSLGVEYSSTLAVIDLFTHTIPAGVLRVGSVITVDAGIYYNFTGGGGIFTGRIQINASLNYIAQISPSPVGVGGIVLRATITVQAVGAGGSFGSTGVGFDTVGATTASTLQAAAALDTTSAPVTVKVQGWSHTNSANNKFRLASTVIQQAG